MSLRKHLTLTVALFMIGTLGLRINASETESDPNSHAKSITDSSSSWMGAAALRLARGLRLDDDGQPPLRHLLASSSSSSRKALRLPRRLLDQDSALASVGAFLDIENDIEEEEERIWEDVLRSKYSAGDQGNAQ